jgi:hypothetical protein
MISLSDKSQTRGYSLELLGTLGIEGVLNGVRVTGFTEDVDDGYEGAVIEMDGASKVKDWEEV